MKIVIPNWSDYNPRKDYKSAPWLRLDSDLPTSKKLHGANVYVRWTYVAILCLVAEENKGGVVEAELSWIADKVKVPEPELLASLEDLQRRKMIEISDFDERDTNVTSTETFVARSLRNVTGRNETGRNVTVTPTPEINAGAETGSRMNHPSEQPADLSPAPPGDPPPANLSPPPTQTEPLPMPAPRRPIVLPRAPKPPSGGSMVWAAYVRAYQAAYSQEPARNAKQNAHCSQLVARLGLDDAIAVVGFYLTHRKAWYVQSVHQLEYCVKDAEALRTQMLGGRQMTAADARHIDEQTSNAQVFANTARRILAQQEEKNGT